MFASARRLCSNSEQNVIYMNVHWLGQESGRVFLLANLGANDGGRRIQPRINTDDTDKTGKKKSVRELQPDSGDFATG